MHRRSALLSALSCLLLIPTSASLIFDPQCTEGGDIFFVAHPDDDLLFQSPNLIHALQSSLLASTCTAIIYLTSGDAGGGFNSYSRARERGSDAAYASMLAHLLVFFEDRDPGSIDLLPTLETAGFPLRNHSAASARRFTSLPSVSRLFLRLPDGSASGAGFAATGDASLRKLWELDIDTLHAIDDDEDGAARSPWTRSGLVTALRDLLAFFRPSRIHLQDWATPDAAVGPTGEHADHVFGARFARAALSTLLVEEDEDDGDDGDDGDDDSYRPQLWSYVQYATQARPPDLNLAQLGERTDWDAEDALEWKTDAFFAYAAFDDELECRDEERCRETNDIYWLWLQRQYFEKAVPDVVDGRVEWEAVE